MSVAEHVGMDWMTQSAGTIKSIEEVMTHIFRNWCMAILMPKDPIVEGFAFNISLDDLSSFFWQRNKAVRRLSFWLSFYRRARKMLVRSFFCTKPNQGASYF